MTIERTPQQELEYRNFCENLRKVAGLDLLQYKQGQMERRIRAYADRNQVSTLPDLWNIVNKDAQSLRKFLDHITINVSEFFRNPDKFDELRDIIIPELLKQKSRLFIWSAGCSYGAEPYSLRIMMNELTPGTSHKIWATDIDNTILAKAREGIYIADDLKNISDEKKAKYFTKQNDKFLLNSDIRNGVSFEQHDLLKSKFPLDADLILCRNVVIYFNDEAKKILFDRFARAIRTGGYLLVGSTERIVNSADIGLQSNRPFFYKRI
jgi:chemotaxis protein methyltransferase CheR